MLIPLGSALFSTDLTMSTNVNLALGTVTCTAASISGSLTASNAVAGTLSVAQLINTNPVYAYWQLSGQVSISSGTSVTIPLASWTLLAPASNIPSGLNLMNSSGAIVIPFKGIYYLNFTWDNGNTSESAQMWWVWSGSGSGNLGGAYGTSVGTYTVLTSAYTGPFAASDVLTPQYSTGSAYSLGPYSPPTPYTALSVCLLQRM